MVRPTDPLIVSLRINCGGRTTSCWPDATKSTQVVAIETVVVIGDALEHTIVIGGVVVAALTGYIVSNTLQRKNIYYIKFPWLKERIPIEE